MCQVLQKSAMEKLDLLLDIGVSGEDGRDRVGSCRVFLSRAQTGLSPGSCVPFRYREDKESYVQWQQQWREKVHGDERVFHSMFGPVKVESKDPETLDDSDLDELLGDDDDDFEQLMETKREERAKEVSSSVPVSSTVPVSHSWIVASNQSLHVVHTHTIVPLPFQIKDLATVRSQVSSGNDVVLVLAHDGFLYNLSLPYPTIIQFWDFRFFQYAKVVTSTSQSVFVLIQYKPNDNLSHIYHNLSIKLFTLVDNEPLQVNLVRSLLLKNDVTQIEHAQWLPSNHPRLVIATKGTTQQIMVLQWDKDNLMNLQENGSMKWHSKINKLIPLSSSHVLIQGETALTLVNIDHVIDEIDVPLKSFQVMGLQNISTFFNAPELLTSLQSMDHEKFTPFHHSTIVLSQENETIYAILSNDERIVCYSLTRFKGMTKISPGYNQDPQSNHFSLMITSFNRIIDLTIDLTQMVECSGEIMHYPPPQSINQRVVIETFTQPHPRSLLQVKDTVWILSNEIISQLSTTSMATRHTTLIHNVIKDLIPFNKIVRLPKNTQFGNLIYATDNLLQTQIYTFEDEIVKLDDLLPCNDQPTLHLRLYEDFVIQFTKKSLISRTFNTGEVITHFNTSEITTFTYLNDILIWGNHEKLWYCPNLKLINSQPSIINVPIGSPLHELWFQNDKTKSLTLIADPINNNQNQTHTLLLKKYDGLYSLSWETFMENNQTSLQNISHIPSTRFQYVNHDLCAFLNYNSNGQPLIKITDLKGDAVSRCDSIGTIFKPGESITMKRLDNNTLSIYSTSHFFLVQLKHDEIICERVQFPYLKHQTVMDLEYDSTNNIIYCLYNSGLRILKLTHLSLYDNDHLLLKAKDEKQFYYLESLHRLLVIHPLRKYWYVMKLENGRMVPLNPQILIDEKSFLQNVVILNEKDECISLLLQFESSLSLVNIIPKNGRLKIQKVDDFHVNKLKSNVQFNCQDNSIVVIHHHATIKKSDILSPTVNSTTLSIITIADDQLKLTDERHLIDIDYTMIENYSIIGKGLLFNTSNGAQLLKNYRNPSICKLITPVDNTITHKIIKLNHDFCLLGRFIDTSSAMEYQLYRTNDVDNIVSNPKECWPTLNTTHLELSDDIWTEENCHKSALNYYNTSNSQEILPILKLPNDIDHYIKGLPQVYPNLSTEHKQQYRFTSFQLSNLIAICFDSKTMTLSILIEGGTVYQFTSQPIISESCNDKPIIGSNLEEMYKHSGFLIKPSNVNINPDTRQGFLWEKV